MTRFAFLSGVPTFASLVFTHEEAAVALARMFWRALRRLETGGAMATSFREMPSRDIARLGQRLEAKRG